MKRNVYFASMILAIAVIAGSSAAVAQTASDPHHTEGSTAPAGQAIELQQNMMGAGMMMGQGMMGSIMQPGSMMGGCPMMGMMMGGEPSDFATGRVAFLKAELAITDAQKAVWDAYAAALRKNLQGMQAMRGNMMAMMAAKTPVERLDSHIALMDAHVGSLKEMRPVMVALQASLSPEQKAKADQILSGVSCMM